MTATTTKAPFVPNCIFILESEGDDPDRKACTLLMLDGDNIYGECFTQDAWAHGGKPFCIRRIGHFETAEGDRVLEGGTVELLPEICIVKINERENWIDPEILAQTTRIFGVYAFDRRRHVHCCSLSPSYELHFLGTQYEETEGLSDEAQDRLNSALIDGDSGTEEVSYFDCHFIDRLLKNPCREGFLPKANEDGGFVVEGIQGVTTDLAVEEVEECYRGSEL